MKSADTESDRPNIEPFTEDEIESASRTALHTIGVTWSALTGEQQDIFREEARAAIAGVPSKSVKFVDLKKIVPRPTVLPEGTTPANESLFRKVVLEELRNSPNWNPEHVPIGYESYTGRERRP